MPDPVLPRRLFLATVGSAVAASNQVAASWFPPAHPESPVTSPNFEFPDSPLPDQILPGARIVRSRRPLDLETPPERLDSWITPIDRFFIRSHFEAPWLDPETLAAWSVRIAGLVQNETHIPLRDLRARDPVERPALIQCAGNGRALFEPRIPGVPWERGAVGQAIWTGIPLRDILLPAGIHPNARHIHIYAADRPPHHKTPTYTRSIPLERALQPDTLLVWKMNGEDLPWQHGGPLRLIVPGWTANHWIKWVNSFILAENEAESFYQRTAYRMPRTPQPPDAVIPPEDLLPVTEQVVKSLITQPARGAKLKQGSNTIQGVAWTGPGRKISRLEIQFDDQPWRDAELFGPEAPDCWRLWRLTLPLPPGKHAIAARATDSNGDAQPEITPWNKSGYLWNGIDRVECEVLR
jgi:DMSO/TMAO reductase YedYZ molybdopterin-dependent catalytic subunit